MHTHTCAHTHTHKCTSHTHTHAHAYTYTHTHTHSSGTHATVESTNGSVEEAVAQVAGKCLQHLVPPPTWQQLEQVICWVGLICSDLPGSGDRPVCNDLPGSGDRPLNEHLQRSQFVLDDSPSILNDTVQTSFLVLGGVAIPDWK